MESRIMPSPQAQQSGFWSIERVVALLTPLFSAAAGWLSTVIANAIPGVNIPAGDFTALFVTGATVAGGAALVWLHGRQKFTAQTFGGVGTLLRSAPAGDIEARLKEHQDAIIYAIGKTVHAPPGADEVAREIVRQLWPTQAASTQPPASR